MNKTYFTLTFNPEPCESPYFPNGYWTCIAEPGYDGAGATPMAAMADCMIVMSKSLIGWEGNA